MPKYCVITAVAALFLSQCSFANATDSAANIKDPDAASKDQCQAIAHACTAAGFKEKGGAGFAFWHDCMKPVILGQTVKGVTVDPEVVKTCRVFKIKKTEQEIQELKNAQK
jgi:hypothetical protein